MFTAELDDRHSEPRAVVTIWSDDRGIANLHLILLILNLIQAGPLSLGIRYLVAFLFRALVVDVLSHGLAGGQKGHGDSESNN